MQNTKYSGPRGAYMYWAVRFLGMETSQTIHNPFGGSPANNQYNTYTYYTRLFEIQLISDSGQNIAPLAVDAPLLQGTADSAAIYASFASSGNDMVYAFRFSRAYRVTRGVVDIRYVYTNWIYEYSYNGFDWYPAAHQSLNGLNTSTRQQVLTEFPPWPSFL